jgi:hypothetical protein
MEILHIEKKSQLLNTLERFHIHNLSIQKLQINDPYTVTHKPIYHLIRRYTYHNNTYSKHSPPPITPNPTLFSFLFAPIWEHRADFSVSWSFTYGRTPWTGDQLVARPLPTHGTTQTQKKHIHTPNIHALCLIRTHDHGFRVSENSSCLRPLGYRDRHPTP